MRNQLQQKNGIINEVVLYNQIAIKNIQPMLQDSFFSLCKQTYPIKILVHANYQAKQTLASKGITPAIFLSPFYRKQQQYKYAMEISYGQKQKATKAFPDVDTVDFQQYQLKNVQEVMVKSIRNIVKDAQIKKSKPINKNTFQNKHNIENYLNNLNFHWFYNSLRHFYHALSLNQLNYKKSTIDQVKGLAFVIQVNNKPLKQNFQKIKRQTDALVKRMYFLNPSQAKTLPILVVVLFNPIKGYEFKDAKSWCQTLKSQYGIQAVLHSRQQINNPCCLQSQKWSSYIRPVFNFQYSPSIPIKILSQQGIKSLSDTINIHKQRIKKNLQSRLHYLMKKFQDHYSMTSKFLGIFKGNMTPKQRYLITEEAEAREMGDLMFVIEDYQKAYDSYKTILKDFQKRQIDIEVDLRYMMSLCFQMGKFVGVQVNNSSPKNFIEKQFQSFEIYQKMGKKQLSKFLVLALFQIHTFKIFDPSLIKQKLLVYIKKAMNMSDQKKPQQHKNTKSYFILPLLIYQQYSNLNLLLPWCDFRRYSYDTVRIAMRYAQYKIYSHALRSLSIVQPIYQNTMNAMQKYISVQLSSFNCENRNLNQSLNKIKEAWKILGDSTQFQHEIKETDVVEFKRMLGNHHKIVNQIIKINGHVLTMTDQQSLRIPYVLANQIRLLQEQQIKQVDRSGLSWTQISQFLSQNSQLFSQGYPKSTMQKTFRLYDSPTPQQKQLTYRINCPSPSPFQIQRHSRISYLAQPIVVIFTFYNPFVQDIQVKDMKLLIKGEVGKIKGDRQGVVVKAHGRVRVAFQVDTNVVGMVQIKGVEWTFQHMRMGYYFKDINHTNTDSKSFYNIIRIVQPKGKLKVTQQANESLLEGQIYQQKITFQNCGSKPIDSIYVAYGCSHFYNKKYEKLNFTLDVGQKRIVKFIRNLPMVPQNIQSDWRIIDRKIYAYRTNAEFRIYRTSIVSVIHKLLYQRIKCQKLSTHLHLLTYSVDKSKKQTQLIQFMIIKNGFKLIKTDKTQFQNTQTIFFYLLKNPSEGLQHFNFKNETINEDKNILLKSYQSLKEENSKKQLQQALKNNQDSLNLQFTWQSPYKKGIIHLCPLQILALKSQILPFLFSCNLPPTMSHNFSLCPILQIPFRIKIKNIFNQTPIIIWLYLSDDNLNGLFWEGITEGMWKVGQNQEVIIESKVVIGKEGVFDVAECFKYIVQQDKHVINVTHSQHQRILIQVKDQSVHVDQSQIRLSKRNSLQTIKNNSMLSSAFKKTQNLIFQDNQSLLMNITSPRQVKQEKPQTLDQIFGNFTPRQTAKQQVQASKTQIQPIFELKQQRNLTQSTDNFTDLL